MIASVTLPARAATRTFKLDFTGSSISLDAEIQTGVLLKSEVKKVGGRGVVRATPPWLVGR